MYYIIDYKSRYGQDIRERVDKNYLIEKLIQLEDDFCTIKLIFIEGYEF